MGKTPRQVPCATSGCEAVVFTLLYSNAPKYCDECRAARRRKRNREALRDGAGIPSSAKAPKTVYTASDLMRMPVEKMVNLIHSNRSNPHFGVAKSE